MGQDSWVLLVASWAPLKGRISYPVWSQRILTGFSVSYCFAAWKHSHRQHQPNSLKSGGSCSIHAP